MAPRLREALRDTPAVLIHGPRQCGKTTLARAVGGPRGYRYLTFDDEAVRAAVVADPAIFSIDCSGADFEHPWHAYAPSRCSTENKRARRPDVVLFVNGLPLGIIVRDRWLR